MPLTGSDHKLTPIGGGGNGGGGWDRQGGGGGSKCHLDFSM